MKKYFLLVLAIILFLNACSPAATQVIPSSLSSTETPSATSTLTATATQIPSTATITPLPTIPTFTPTFDVRTIVTVTPAPKAECPKENPYLIPDFNNCKGGVCSIPDSETILKYLNSGGTLDKTKYLGDVADFTGNRVKGLLAYTDSGSFNIYGCIDGKYQVLQEFKGTQRTPYLDYVGDLNGDGIPELIVSNYERHAFNSIQIFEWSGNTFTSLIDTEFVDAQGKTQKYDWLGGTPLSYKIINNQNGGKEIVAVDQASLYLDPAFWPGGLPWRDETITLKWNGENFIIASEEYSPPQYRFQAVQDADRYTLRQAYDRALYLYRTAIFSDKLDWWSKERKEYERYNALNSYFDKMARGPGIIQTVTPTPFPTMSLVTPDLTEYPRLAAYAYYRIMLLQFVHGHESDANTIYKTLQQKFGNDQYGRPYAEMATAFWNTYQSTHKMYDGCASAIEYAAEHPEILVPLGSDYHGWQSKMYKPEDVCPFR